MEKPVHFSESVSKLVSNQRFEFRFAEVKKKLEQLKVDGLINEKQFAKIQDEDMLLKIKYRSFKKCIRQLIISLLLIGIGFMMGMSLGYLLIVGGIIVSISSFFGITTNWLSKNQRAYLKK